MSRSWLHESARRRSGGGPHRPARAWRERDALAEAEAWAEAEEHPGSQPGRRSEGSEILSTHPLTPV